MDRFGIDDVLRYVVARRVAEVPAERRGVPVPLTRRRSENYNQKKKNDSRFHGVPHLMMCP